MYLCIKALNHTPQTCLNSDRIFIPKDVGKVGFGESNSISIHMVIYIIYMEILDASKGHG